MKILNGQISTLSTALPLTKSRSKHSNVSAVKKFPVILYYININNILNFRLLLFCLMKSTKEILRIQEKLFNLINLK